MKHSIDALLDRDHAVLLALAQELRHCVRPTAVRMLFKHFAAALAGHVTALRQVVYPALKSPGPGDSGSELVLADTRFVHSFAELLTLSPDDSAFAEVLSDVLQATVRLIERERTELMPMLREQLDDGQRLSLALEAEPYLSHPGAADEHGLRLYPADWIEEARLLLGGLQAAPPVP